MRHHEYERHAVHHWNFLPQVPASPTPLQHRPRGARLVPRPRHGQVAVAQQRSRPRLPWDIPGRRVSTHAHRESRFAAGPHMQFPDANIGILCTTCVCTYMIYYACIGILVSYSYASPHMRLVQPDARILPILVCVSP